MTSLMSALPVEKDVSYELFGAEQDRYTFNGEREYPFASVNIPDAVMLERLWHHFKVNSFGKKQGYDLILYPAAARVLPTSFKVKGVAVVNDVVSHILHYTKDEWYRKCIKRGLSRANCIIASSEYIRSNLENIGISPRRIEVIHNGVDHSCFYPGESISADSEIIDIKPFAIKKPYIIYASRMQNAEKKHLELIEAFARFKKRTNLPHRLVLAGNIEPKNAKKSENSDEYSDKVHTAVLGSGVASDIFITGYFPHEHFPELYRNADACVFPSIAEGVGLPVLESMACGLPVACSSQGALREIAGDAALFFDSNNIEEIEQALERIVGDGELRKTLLEKGIKQAKQYSWQQTALATASLLKSL